MVEVNARNLLKILLGVVVSVAIAVGVVITWFGFFPAVGIIDSVGLEIVSEDGHTICLRMGILFGMLILV